jgi:hypothetical protein
MPNCRKGGPNYHSPRGQATTALYLGRVNAKPPELLGELLDHVRERNRARRSVSFEPPSSELSFLNVRAVRNPRAKDLAVDPSRCHTAPPTERVTG